jgi:hypothetical protein
MRSVQLCDVAGQSFTSSFQPIANVRDACVYLAGQLGIQEHEIRIIDYRSRFCPMPSRLPARQVFFQGVLTSRPDGCVMSPSARFSRVKALAQRPLSAQAREEYQSYAEVSLLTPPNFEQRVAHLASLGFPPDACAETLRMVGFDVRAAIELLTNEEVRIEVERTHILERPMRMPDSLHRERYRFDRPMGVSGQGIVVDLPPRPPRLANSAFRGQPRRTGDTGWMDGLTSEQRVIVEGLQQQFRESRESVEELFEEAGRDWNQFRQFFE